MDPLPSNQQIQQYKDMSWRVDVTISHTHLARVFRPSVVMQFNTIDDQAKEQSHVIEMSPENLGRLRFEVAKALKHSLEIQASSQGK